MVLARPVRDIGLTLVIGTAGAAIARAVQLPGGPMVGALIAAGAARVLGAPVEQPPPWLRNAGRTVLGLTIGITVTAETVRVVAGSLLPVAIMVLFMLALGFGTAWVLIRLAHMSVPTALCGSSPGALAAMVTLADDLGGSAPVVASMHLVRLVSVMLVIPPFVHGAFSPTPEAATVVLTDAAAGGSLFWRQAVLLVLGLAVGLLVARLKLPAGDLLCGLVIAAVANPAFLHLPDLPITWKLFAQIAIGSGIGATVSRQALSDFRPFALAGGLMTIVFISLGLLLAWVLSTISGLDLITCVVGCAPGGADTMIILAGEFGANVPLVTAMHVSRMVILMLVLPPLISRMAQRKAGDALAAAGVTVAPDVRQAGS